MSLLSDEDIKNELGKNIFIYPLKIDLIKGSSINLRPSRLSWSIKTQNSIFNTTSNKIVIPPNDTALIETEETLYITKKISGSYHSRVQLVSKGLGHIGTTLDPGWIGPSLIALHNHSKDVIEIDLNEPFISIMFFYLKSESKKDSTNSPAHPGILGRFNISDFEQKWIDEGWRKDRRALERIMIECNEYKDLKQRRKNPYDVLKIPVIINIICLVLCLIVFGLFEMTKEQSKFPSSSYIVPILCVYLTASTNQILNFFKSRTDK